MSLRRYLEDWQIQWARRKGIRVGPPHWNPGSTARGYVSELQENLFEPLSERVKKQFIDGAGGELKEPDGQSGNMYAVYSSSALCANLFHLWSRLLDAAPPNTKPRIDPLLNACNLPWIPATGIDFEVQQVVNPAFFNPPHLDVQISFDESHLKCAGIEAKFCEPYGDKRPGGLKPCYLRERTLWRDWPNLRAFAERLSPTDLTHAHLHAAQLLIHLLGLRRQHGTNFVLVYLWFDVPRAEAAKQHRQEIDFFAEVLKRDGVAFFARTYQQVFESLRGDRGEPKSPHVRYLLERYLDVGAEGA
jgi:hypothetical protein